MSYKNKRILITGGAGFIGSALAEHLVKDGADITIVDSLIPEYGGNLFNLRNIKTKINLNISDVRDPHAMSYHVVDKDYLFNLAGQTSHLDSMTDPKTDLDINAAAQLTILEACRKNNPNIKIVFASTRQIYGRPQYLPVDEKHPIIPVDVNGINKLAGEWYHLLYNQVYGIRACALRLTNTFGPGMRIKDARQTFLGIWIKNLIENKVLDIYGTGEQLRDFNYVDDTVSALLLAGLENKADGQIFNLGSHERISLTDLAKSMIAIFGKGDYHTIPFPPQRKAIDIGDYYSDYTKAQQIIGWQPTTPLKDALNKTIAFYKEHIKEYI